MAVLVCNTDVVLSQVDSVCFYNSDTINNSHWEERKYGAYMHSTQKFNNEDSVSRCSWLTIYTATYPEFQELSLCRDTAYSCFSFNINSKFIDLNFSKYSFDKITVRCENSYLYPEIGNATYVQELDFRADHGELTKDAYSIRVPSEYLNLVRLRKFYITASVLIFPDSIWYTQEGLTIGIENPIMLPPNIENVSKIDSFLIQSENTELPSALMLLPKTRNVFINTISIDSLVNENGKISIMDVDNLIMEYNKAKNKSHSGKFEVRYLNGKLAIQGNFRKGEYDGVWKFYNTKGELTETRHYRNGIPIGTWVINSPQKNKLEFIDYHKGVILYNRFHPWCLEKLYYENWNLIVSMIR